MVLVTTQAHNPFGRVGLKQKNRGLGETEDRGGRWSHIVLSGDNRAYPARPTYRNRHHDRSGYLRTIHGRCQQHHHHQRQQGYSKSSLRNRHSHPPRLGIPHPRVQGPPNHPRKTPNAPQGRQHSASRADSEFFARQGLGREGANCKPYKF